MDILAHLRGILAYLREAIGPHLQFLPWDPVVVVAVAFGTVAVLLWLSYRMRSRTAVPKFILAPPEYHEPMSSGLKLGPAKWWTRGRLLGVYILGSLSWFLAILKIVEHLGWLS